MSAKIQRQIELILDDVLKFHAELERNKDFATGVGIRDFGLLESAVNAPFQTFGGQDLYETIFDKAAHLAHGLTKNHGFVDGNKRVAIHAMLVYLMINDIDLDYTQEELVQIGLGLADSTISPEKLSLWLKNRERFINVR
ncbi:MAG: type II toxin-antitoxin system death-on-curing family toxin [Selenomonadaceae bacterium]|nr:type II toxin-antitoxin system death-on-curing family toxin [Selenomonadaceae bacterium]